MKKSSLYNLDSIELFESIECLKIDLKKSDLEYKEIFDKNVALINNFKRYFTDHNQVVYENPSPGNKVLHR